MYDWLAVTVLALLIPSETRRKLLTRFLMHPQEEHYGAQLHRMLELHPNSVHRELKLLERAGIIISRRAGGIVYYRANTSSPVFPELRVLILKTAGLGECIADSLRDLRGIDWALVYGSVARGDEGPGSDVDLMVIGDVPAREVEDAVDRLEEAVGRPVNHTVLTRDELRRRCQARDGFVCGVLDGAKIMLLGDEDELRRAAE